MHDCLIAFGSNEGNSTEILETCVEKLRQISGVSRLKSSQPVVTKPVGGPEGQSAYLNAAIRLETELSASQLHQHLVRIETELGRERRQRWGARKIDLDLLIHGHLQIETEVLTIPHPRMSFRKFVLKPANEIASDLIHPPSGLTIEELNECLLTRRDTILFVGDELDSAYASAVRSSLPERWSLELAYDKSDFESKAPFAKLVCFVSNGDVLSELKSLASRVSGPTLCLPEELKKCQIEIEAAIEAMS